MCDMGLQVLASTHLGHLLPPALSLSHARMNAHVHQLCLYGLSRRCFWLAPLSFPRRCPPFEGSLGTVSWSMFRTGPNHVKHLSLTSCGTFAQPCMEFSCITWCLNTCLAKRGCIFDEDIYYERPLLLRYPLVVPEHSDRCGTTCFTITIVQSYLKVSISGGLFRYPYGPKSADCTPPLAQFTLN